MLGRDSKFFLPAIFGISVFIAGFMAPSYIFNVQAQVQQTGSITVCKIIVDDNGNIVDGSARSGVSFDISGISPAQNSGPVPAGQIGNSHFTTPLTFNAGIIGSNDAQCTTYSNLALGSYYYGEESINPSVGWKTPKYNDQFSTAVNSINDFFGYDGNLFDGNAANDASRNTDADGHIILESGRSDRTLVVLNEYEAVIPSSGGTGGSTGPSGASAPTCPISNVQKVDQVWFSNVTSTQTTVHWANHGDAHSYHIAYGPDQNNLPWGVQVPGNLNNYTLLNLQGGSLWVKITANASADCGGPTSDPFQAGKASGGQVLGINTLADTGMGNNLLLLIAGFGSIGLGLLQAQRVLQKKD